MKLLLPQGFFGDIEFEIYENEKPHKMFLDSGSFTGSFDKNLRVIQQLFLSEKI